MNCYFIIPVSLEPGEDRADYGDYIELVRPTVKKHRGRYVVRSEGIEYMGRDWHPDHSIIVWFSNRGSTDRYFFPEEYRGITSKRENTVDSQAIIITAGEMYGDNRDKKEGKMG